MSHPIHLILSAGTRIVTRNDAGRDALLCVRDRGGAAAHALPPQDLRARGEIKWKHLAAIALQAGRAKDKARLLQFIEAGALNATRFQAMLSRHGLVDCWRQFERQFLTP